MACEVSRLVCRRARRCRCGGSLNHTQDGEVHFAPASKTGAQQLCQYQEHLHNKIYTCSRCHARGITMPLTKKIAPSAYSSSTPLAFAYYLWQGYAFLVAQCST